MNAVYELPRISARSAELDVQIAATDDDYEAVYRLRYRVYVEELAFHQRYADHERQRVKDPLDDTALVLLARVGGAGGGYRPHQLREEQRPARVHRYSSDA